MSTAWAGAILAAVLSVALAAVVEPAIISSGNVNPAVDEPGDATVLSFIGVAVVPPGGAGSLTVNGGSVLTITPDLSNISAINMGGRETPTPVIGQGSLVIDGGTLNIVDNPLGSVINVGRAGVGSTGTFTITNGGVYLGQAFNVGRARATGTMTVRGPGSRVDLMGVDIDGGESRALIGRNGGFGSLTLSDGATLTLVGSELATNITGGFVVGREPGSVGSFTIETGSTVAVSPSSLGGGFTLGRDATAAGTVLVRSGSTVSITSILGGGGLTIGQSGTGTFTLTGAGSAILLDGQGATATPAIAVGQETGSVGTLNIQDGAVLTLNRESAGCCMSVGRLGDGRLNITGGGKLVLNDTSTGGGGLSFGGTSTTATGGRFSALVSGPGSELTVNGINAVLSIGRNDGSSGTMTVTSGAQVRLAANGRGAIGATAGSTGVVSVLGGGTVLDTGAFLGIGRSELDGPGGTGTLTVADGATVRAGQISIGAGGTLNGCFGTIVGDVVNNGGTVNPGCSPGRLTITGNYQSNGGRIVIEVDATGNADVLTITGTAASVGQIQIVVDPAFRPAGGARLDVVQVAPSPGAAPAPALTVVVPSGGSGPVTSEGTLSAAVTSITLAPVAAAGVRMQTPTDAAQFPLLPTPVRFSWTDLAAVTQYGFEFTGPNRVFANPRGTAPDTVNGFGGAGGAFGVQGTEITAQLAASFPHGRYQVRVIPLSAGGLPAGVFSDALTIVLGPLNLPPDSRPTITQPANQSPLTPGTLTFSWTPIPGVTQYLFEFTGPGRQFAVPNDVVPDPANALGNLMAAQASVTVTIPPGLVPGPYQVRVISLTASGTPAGSFSDVVTVVAP